MGTRAESGAISLRDGVIHVDGPADPRWGQSYTLDVRDVLLIGELTNDHGPMLDDWFLQFFTSVDEVWGVPCYAEGCIEFVEALAKHLGEPLEQRLVSSANWASNVLWPPPLAGRPIYTFTDIRADTKLGRTWEWMTGGPRQNWQELTPEVRAFLVEAGRRG